jgi:hypothetical protein
LQFTSATHSAHFSAISGAQQSHTVNRVGRDGSLPNSRVARETDYAAEVVAARLVMSN